MEESLAGQSTESVTDQAHDLAQPRGFSRPPSRYCWQTFCEDLPTAFLVPASKAARLEMNFNLPSLPG
jgi:hypothetical protein